MRAVNLIPPEERLLRTGGSVSDKPGAGYLLLLAALTVALLVSGAWTLGARSLADTRGQVKQAEAQAEATETEAASLQRFVDLSALRTQRAATVGQLAANRFDWSRALRELARVSPRDLVLTGLQGSISPDATTTSSAVGETSSLRSALPVPALELAGCVGSQDRVASTLLALRGIEGVTRVTLKDTERNAASQDAGQQGATPTTRTGDDCRRGGTQLPRFSAVLFFDPAAGLIRPGQPSARTVQTAVAGR